MAARTSASTTAQKSKGPETQTQGGGIHLPSVPVPHVHVAMPTGTAGRVLWWGGLATVAALGVVDWPVAVLVGAGSWVAEQYAKASQRPEGERSAGQGQAPS